MYIDVYRWLEVIYHNKVFLPLLHIFYAKIIIPHIP